MYRKDFDMYRKDFDMYRKDRDMYRKDFDMYRKDRDMYRKEALLRHLQPFNTRRFGKFVARAGGQFFLEFQIMNHLHGR